ncbi:hypothetical protein Ancab_023008 [Ancistrocladus abbreviatus]
MRNDEHLSASQLRDALTKQHGSSSYKQLIRGEDKWSTVMQFGDISVSKETLSTFMGSDPPTTSTVSSKSKSPNSIRDDDVEIYDLMQKKIGHCNGDSATECVSYVKKLFRIMIIHTSAARFHT